MAKSQNDIIYDNGTLAYLRERVTRLAICSSQPGSYAAANSTTGVMLAKSNLLTSTDFTLADGATDGRMITLAAQNGISVLKSGTMTHGAWLGSTGSQLLAVTTITSAFLTSGGLVNAPAHYFEIGDLTPFSPTNIVGLATWYDFSDISTLYQDSSKTTPVTSDADPIGAVEDKSGNGNDATQGTTAAKPAYKTAIQNSLSAGLGDGGDYLASGAFTEATQPTTLFIVMRNPAIATFESVVDGISGTKRHLIQPLSSGSTLRVNAGTSLDTASGATTSTALYAIVFNGSSSVVRRNGSQINTGNAGTQGITGVTLFAGNGGSSNFTGYIMEYLLYDAEITGTDLSNIETYLNDKWAVY